MMLGAAQALSSPAVWTKDKRALVTHEILSLVTTAYCAHLHTVCFPLRAQGTAANVFHRNAEGVRERTQLCFRLLVSLNGWVHLGSPEKQNQQMMGMVINNKSESKNFAHGYGVRILRLSVFKVEEMQETERNISSMTPKIWEQKEVMVYIVAWVQLKDWLKGRDSELSYFHSLEGAHLL